MSAASTRIAKEALQKFRTSQRGEVLDEIHPEYEAARGLWNGLIDRKPALIARCTGVADVVNAVNFAREHGLLVALRGGGHHTAGFAMCDGGLVIDLSPMKGVRVDPIKQTVQAQPGLTYAEFDRETALFGLATTGGQISTTGIAGLTVGGGIGWLGRKYGLTCDNLLSADVVTAEGQVLVASASENTDLFWGLRGGGGNFGIVTSFEYRLYPITQVLAGWIVYPMAQAKEVLKFLRGWMPTLPDGATTLIMFITARPDWPLPPSYRNAVVCAVSVCFVGPQEEGEKVLKPLRAFGSPLADLVRPLPYTTIQTASDRYLVPGTPAFYKSTFLNELSDDAIEILVEEAAAMTPLSHLHVMQLGGAVSRVGEDETAFSYRKAGYECYILPIWTNREESDQHIEWARKTWSQLQPFSLGVGYLNRETDEQGDRLPAAFGRGKYERLVALKNKYDPTNFFRFNHNIKPSLGEGRRGLG